METRLTELEIKYSYAEDLLEALNLTVYRQQEQIKSLEQQLALLTQQLDEMARSGPRASSAELPPHY
ncbi:MAG: SlyX family protein [Thiobacillaceae bacterium]